MKETCGRDRNGDCSDVEWEKTLCSSDALAALALCVPSISEAALCSALAEGCLRPGEYTSEYTLLQNFFPCILSQLVAILWSSWLSPSRNKLYNIMGNQKENNFPLTLLEKYISNQKSSHQILVYCVKIVTSLKPLADPSPTFRVSGFTELGNFTQKENLMWSFGN